MANFKFLVRGPRNTQWRRDAKQPSCYLFEPFLRTTDVGPSEKAKQISHRSEEMQLNLQKRSIFL